MRVLHIGKYFPPYAGGMENFLGDLCPALERQGFTIGVLVHDDPVSKQKVKDKTNSFFVKRVPSYGQLLYAPISPGFLISFNAVIKKFKPDLLHFHMPNTSAFCGMALRRAKKIPWIVHWHSDVVASKIDTRLALAYRFYRPFEQLMLKKAQAIIATSPRYLESSEALSRWNEKCHVVPLGLSPDRITINNYTMSGLWADKGLFKVVSVGRLTYYKGHELLIKAAAELDNIEVVIVGSGERYEKLNELILSLGVGQRVKLAGFLPNESLYSLLSDADCFCLPSVERTEAFGVVLLEAMLYGKPVVASDVPGAGMGWVVDNGKTGFLVPPNSPAALVKSLKELVGNPKMAGEMGAAGLNKFHEYFHINKVAGQICQLYRQI